MAQYTLASVAFKEQKQINGNDMHIYTIGVADANGQVVMCELLQRPTSPQPQQGAAIEGEIKPSSNPNYLPTFRRPQKQGGRGGGMSPQAVAGMQRSHAQEMALRFYEATGGAPIDWANADGATLQAAVDKQVGYIERVADRFDAGVKAAVQAVGGGGQQQAQPAQQPPPQQTAPPPQQPPAQPPAQQPPPQQGFTPPPTGGVDDDIPF